MKRWIVQARLIGASKRELDGYQRAKGHEYRGDFQHVPSFS